MSLYIPSTTDGLFPPIGRLDLQALVVAASPKGLGNIHLKGEPEAMPLLQHALVELWKQRHGRWLLSQEYRAIDGVQGAIAHTADHVYNKLLPEQKSLAANCDFGATAGSLRSERAQPLNRTYKWQ